MITGKGISMHRGARILRCVVGGFWLIASVVCPVSSMAASRSPLQVIQSGSDRGLQIIKSSLFEGGPSLQQRRDEILTIVEEYFDFSEMSKRAMGRPWKDVSPQQQQAFIVLFKQLLFNTYVNRIETAASPATTFRYDGETIDGQYAIVTSRVVNSSQSEVHIDYRLLLQGTDWKVYDVVIEGISLVGNYRQQFSSILTSQSFGNLLKRLEEKVQAK